MMIRRFGLISRKNLINRMSKRNNKLVLSNPVRQQQDTTRNMCSSSDETTSFPPTGEDPFAEMMDQFDVIDDTEFQQLYEDAKSVFGEQSKSKHHENKQDDQDDLDPIPLLSEKEKRMMYDLFTSVCNDEGEPSYTNEELADKFRVDVKTVKAVLTMQQIVREAEAQGEIRVEEDLNDHPQLENWEEYNEWLKGFEEKTANQYHDGHVGHMKRQQDFEFLFPDREDETEEKFKRQHEAKRANFNSSEIRREIEKHTKTAADFSGGQAEFEKYQSDSLRRNAEFIRLRTSEFKKTINPRLTNPDYNKGTKSDLYRYKTIFHDISEASSTKDQYKVLGVLDHDGTFRDATEEELLHRYKRTTPAPLKKSVRRALQKRKQGRLI